MRLDDLGNELPRGIYQKHGRYYLVLKNKWHALTQSLPDSIEYATAIRLDEGRFPSMTAFLKSLYTVAKNNARGVGPGRTAREFTLPGWQFLVTMAANQNMKCAVTGTPFDIKKDRVSGKRPLAPSLDRIDSARGYTEDNVRLVCVITNYALNSWGEDYFATIAKNYCKNRLEGS